MKNIIKYIAVVTLSLVACEPEFENPIDENGFYTSGGADFSNYVALGNSLTAGFADGALYTAGQENSYPNILATQFALVGGGGFTQPLMADNLGGLLLGGNQIAGNRLVLTQNASGELGAVAVLSGTPTTDVSNVLTGSFNNMGVPGAKSFHLLADTYGDIAGFPDAANPYFIRFASSPGTTIVADAVAQNPTFFSLWIGNNDALGYAISGGDGTDELSPVELFTQAYQSIVASMTQTGAKGIVINMPDISSIPFFTTVPNNALVIDTETALSLTGFFQAVSGIVFGNALLGGASQAEAQVLAAQYAFSFSAGPNNFLIDVPATAANPLGVRQMTGDELLLLTIDQEALAQGYGSVVLTQEVLQVLGLLQQGGTPTAEEADLVLAAISGIDDKDALASDELAEIAEAQAAYNQVIEETAAAFDLAFYDAKSDLTQASNEGIRTDAGLVTSTFASGGAFSLDGVHLTARGYAITANGMIDAINAKYGSNVPKVNPGSFPTIYIE